MKSNASDYMKIIEAIYIDASMKCIADVSDVRDLMTIRSRVEYEGLSFLTITLPQFCRDFERSLANGKIDSTLFAGFKRHKRGPIPAFLRGMVSLIFHSETGELIHDEVKPPIDSGRLGNDIPTLIEAVRQICLTFKKLELACTPEREAAAFSSFIKIESDFEKFSVPTEDLSKFLDVSSMLWDNLVVDFSPTMAIPRHGPGATAERISGNGKYRWRYWYDRLESYFPLIDNGYPLGLPFDSEELERVTIVPELLEQPVRVTPVPKTLKGPRVIAIEPCCMQFIQQGIRDWLYASLETYWLTAGHINFRDQAINQRLAMTSSMDGRLATIDLSDASDRVPRSLALDMFRASPALLGSIDSCRSTKALLPDGTIISPLRKFASMGSALCFPVEAMYFYTICIVALLESRKLSCTFQNIFNVSRDVYVYGDDIIVPVTDAIIVLEYLQKYNCKVNTNKTFVSGCFRESCGVDAYGGYEVTPVYLRQERPENRQQPSRIISWVATANLFYKKGYWRTTQLIRSIVERCVGSLPYVSEDSEALGHHSFLGYRSASRWNDNLQRLEIKALVPRPVRRTDKLEGYGALMKCFLDLARGIERNPLLDGSEGVDLEHSELRGEVTLKRRWVAAT
jgi:hypothetical protein